MKKVKFGLFIIFMMMLPGFVYADSISLSCPTSATTGSTITCSLSANTSKSIISYQVDISLPADFSILGDKINYPEGNAADWQNGDDISADGKIQAYNSVGAGPGEILLGTLKIVIGNNAELSANTITLSNAEITYEDKYEEVQIGGATATVTVSNGTTPSSSTGLKSLTASVGNLSPMFSVTNYSYMLVLPTDISTFSVTAEPNNTNAVVTFTDADTGELLTPNSIKFSTQNKPSMLIRIKVDQEEKEYVLIVKRESSSTVGKGELTSLTIGGKKVDLVSGKYNYEVYLDDVSSYLVEATLDDTTNYKFDDYLVLPFTGHQEGEVPIIILPKTEGLSGNTYIILVKKSDSGSSNTPTPTPTPASSSRSNVSTNPTTGSSFVTFTFIVMMVAFGVSYYLYKQGLSKDN